MANEKYVQDLLAAEACYAKLMNRIKIVKQFLADCERSGVSAINKTTTGGCEISYGGKGGEMKTPVTIKVTAADGKGINEIKMSEYSPGENRVYKFFVAGREKPFKVVLAAGDQGDPGQNGKYIEDPNLKHALSLIGASASKTAFKASATALSASASVYSLTLDAAKILGNVSYVSMAGLSTAFEAQGIENNVSEEKIEQNEQEIMVDNKQEKIVKTDEMSLQVGTTLVKEDKEKMEEHVPVPTKTNTEVNGMENESNG